MRHKGQISAVTALGLTMGLLMACTPAAQDEVAREAAKRTVTPIVAAQVPGVPVAPVVDCVIDNATRGEVLTLAAGAVTGSTATAAEVTADILARRGTVTCITRAGLSGAFT